MPVGILTRFGPSIAGLLGMGLAAALHALVSADAYHTVFGLWGVQSFRYPFLDLDGPLAARDCARLGFDVYVFNPCDVIDRVHNYSPLWLAFPNFPPHQDNRFVLGLAVDLLFFIGLSVLPAPATLSELVLRVFAAISTVVAFAAERANVDVIIFLLVLIMLVALRGGFALRVLGYAIALLAASFKYYPATLLLLAIREKVLRFVSVGALAVVAGLLFLVFFGHDVYRSIPNIPGGYAFADVFGAGDIRFVAAEMLQAGGAGPAAIFWVPVAVLAAAIAGTVILGFDLLRTLDWRFLLSCLDNGRRDALLAGVLLSLGCFLAGQSLDYRAIFLLFCPPGLSAIAREPNMKPRWILRSTPVLLVFLLWEQAARSDLLALGLWLGWPKAAIVAVIFAFMVVRETGFWLLMTVLAVILAAFIAGTPAWAMLGHLRLRQAPPAPETTPQTARN